MISNSANAAHELKEIWLAVRAGIWDGEGHLYDQRVGAKIGSLRKACRESPDLLHAADALTLQVLDAEFHYQRGRYRDATNVLVSLWDDFGKTLATEDIRTIRARLSKEIDLFRAEISGLLHYVFYRYHTIDGRTSQAIFLIAKIHALIQTIRFPMLKERELSLCEFFLGACHSASGSFDQAEHHFTEADMVHPPSVRPSKAFDLNITEEYAEVKTINAEVSSALGWADCQRGRLRRAEHLQKIALGALSGLNHDSLSRVIAFRSAAARRRLYPFAQRSHNFALRELESGFDQLQTSDNSVALLSAFELAREHLDVAEFVSKDRLSVTGSLNDAKQWVARAQARSRNPTDVVRGHLLLARLERLKGSRGAAEAHVNAARDLVIEKSLSRHLLTEIALEEAMNAPLTNQILLKVLQTIRSSAESSSDTDSRQSNPVLEAECWLRLSERFIEQGNPVQAEDHLTYWGTLSQFVQNQHLSCLADRIRRRLDDSGDGFKLEYEFEMPTPETPDKPTLSSRRDQFERWMLKSALRRLPKPVSWEALGAVYGVKRDTMRRRAKELNITLPNIEES